MLRGATAALGLLAGSGCVPVATDYGVFETALDTSEGPWFALSGAGVATGSGEAIEGIRVSHGPARDDGDVAGLWVLSGDGACEPSTVRAEDVDVEATLEGERFVAEDVSIELLAVERSGCSRRSPRPGILQASPSCTLEVSPPCTPRCSASGSPPGSLVFDGAW